jgi:hypothetical protein
VQRCVRLVSYIASGLGPDILSLCAIVGSCNYHAHLVEDAITVHQMLVFIYAIFQGCYIVSFQRSTIHKGIVYMLALDQIKNGYVSF